MRRCTSNIALNSLSVSFLYLTSCFCLWLSFIELRRRRWMCYLETGNQVNIYTIFIHKYRCAEYEACVVLLLLLQSHIKNPCLVILMYCSSSPVQPWSQLNRGCSGSPPHPPLLYLPIKLICSGMYCFGKEISRLFPLHALVTSFVFPLNSIIVT